MGSESAGLSSMFTVDPPVIVIMSVTILPHVAAKTPEPPVIVRLLLKVLE